MILAIAAAAIVGVLFFNKERAVEEVNSMQAQLGSNWNRFDSLFKKYASLNDIPWEWLKAIALNESSLGNHPSVRRGLEVPSDIEGSKSDDGKSWGLMQVTVTTARDMDPLATSEKLNNAEYSIKLAAQYLKWLKRYFPDGSSRQVEWLIKSYNQGAGNSIKERDGKSTGFAAEYWSRFVRNLERVRSNA